MRNKNSYIIIYTVALCVIAASVLAVVKQSLTERQDENIAYDNKKKILNTVMDITVLSKAQVDEIYANRVRPMIIDFKGVIQTDLKLKDVDVVKQKALKVEERMLPIYRILDEKDSTKKQLLCISNIG